MRVLTEKRKHDGSNALGGRSVTMRQALVVEQSDVGSTRGNFRGYRQPGYKFRQDDVGKVIEVITDGTEYTCWAFGSVFDDVPDRVEVES